VAYSVALHCTALCCIAFALACESMILIIYITAKFDSHLPQLELDQSVIGLDSCDSPHNPRVPLLHVFDI